MARASSAKTLTLSVLFLAIAVPLHARLGAPKRVEEQAPSEPSQPFGVHLWLEDEVFKNGTTSKEGFGYFVGNVSLGPQSQVMRMLFDVALDRTWAVSARCDSPGCKQHARYVPPEGPGEFESFVLSTDAADERDRFTGELVRDRVCVGRRLGNQSDESDSACTEMSIVAVSGVEEKSVIKQKFDGMLGLTIPARNLHKSFLDQLDLGSLPRQFGFYVSDSGRNAELVFGGYDSRRLDSDLVWVPVIPDRMGFWLIDLKGVRVGGHKVNGCSGPKGCYGLLQIGTPTISMHAGTLPAVTDAISYQASTDGHCQLPDLSFDLHGGASLTLEVEDYAGAHCKPELQSHAFEERAFGNEVVILGEPVFRRYYTVFDWQRKRLGFGRAKVERHCERLGRVGLPLEDCVETEEILLFQTEIIRHEL